MGAGLETAVVDGTVGGHSLAGRFHESNFVNSLKQCNFGSLQFAWVISTDAFW